MSDQNSDLVSENISDIMQSAYIDYSMSVIVSRALPDVRDGFKPVHRRVLYAMLRKVYCTTELMINVQELWVRF